MADSQESHQEWNASQNSRWIDVFVQSGWVARVYTLFQGDKPKSVTIKSGSIILGTLNTCTDADGKGSYAGTMIANGSQTSDIEFQIIPQFGSDCNSLPSMRFAGPVVPPIMLVTYDSTSVHAHVYSYHFKVNDNDGVHITIVIEDASGG